jgi:hypothetical protein
MSCRTHEQHRKIGGRPPSDHGASHVDIPLGDQAFDVAERERVVQLPNYRSQEGVFWKADFLGVHRGNLDASGEDNLPSRDQQFATKPRPGMVASGLFQRMGLPNTTGSSLPKARWTPSMTTDATTGTITTTMAGRLRISCGQETHRSPPGMAQ